MARWNTVSAVPLLTRASTSLQGCRTAPYPEKGRALPSIPKDMGVVVSQVKAAGSPSEAGSTACFISPDILFCQKQSRIPTSILQNQNLLIRTQWLSKTKIQLLATEARMDENELSSPASSLLQVSIWVIQRQWYTSSYCKGISSYAWKRRVPLFSAHNTVLTGYTDLSASPPLSKPSSLHHTHRNRGVCLNPENRGLNFFTPLHNMRPFQNTDTSHDWQFTKRKCSECNGIKLATPLSKIHPEQPLPPLPHRNSRGHGQVAVPCVTGPKAAAPRAAGPSHWSRWKTKTQPLYLAF